MLDFANNPNFACDSTAFLDNWPKYGLKVRELVDKNIATDWNSDVENLLLLLHVFPSKSKRLPLRDAMKKLIVFRVVSYLSFFSIRIYNQYIVPEWHHTRRYD